MRAASCSRCESRDDLIEGDGPPICRQCVDLYTKAAASEVEHDRTDYGITFVQTDPNVTITIQSVQNESTTFRYYSEDRPS